MASPAMVDRAEAKHLSRGLESRRLGVAAPPVGRYGAAMTDDNKPAVSDPRSAALDAQLAAMDPRRELVYRCALMSLSPHCRSDADWQKRAAALRKQLKLGEDGLSLVLREARALESQLIGSAAKIAAERRQHGKRR